MMSAGAEPFWLKHVASAVPDHAVAPALRHSRDPETVLALITEHSTQPSAYKHTDKEWRKAVAKEKKAEQKKHDKSGGKKAAGESSGHAEGSGSKPTDAIAARLARAHEQREHHGADAAVASSEGPDEDYVDVSEAEPASSQGLERWSYERWSYERWSYAASAPERPAFESLWRQAKPAPTLSAHDKAEQRKMLGIHTTIDGGDHGPPPTADQQVWHTFPSPYLLTKTQGPHQLHILPTSVLAHSAACCALPTRVALQAARQAKAILITRTTARH